MLVICIVLLISGLTFYAQTVKDKDGNTYKTVKIGTQKWMTENLRTTRYNDGIPIPGINDNNLWNTTTTPAYCWYDNDSVSFANPYGALYNWHVVNTGKLCPEGWRVPDNDDWKTLVEYLIENGYNFDGTVINDKTAKSMAGTSKWNASTKPGAVGNTDYPACRNKSGFTALPGGYRSFCGLFDGLGSTGIWWSATPRRENDIRAYYRYMNYNNRHFYSYQTNNENGFSVRCLKKKM